MARDISHFKLGLFIVVCGGLLFAVVLWLGVTQFFGERRTYATYFDESVRGIQRDTSVNYRGISVGKVESVGLAPDGRLIEVLMGLQPEFVVSNNLAVQVQEQGLTGLRYLEIDSVMENLEELTPDIAFEPQYPVIPSVPSGMQQLRTALETIYERFSDLDMKTLLNRWTETAERLNAVLANTERIMETGNLAETMIALQHAAMTTSDIIQSLSELTASEGMRENIRDLSAILTSTRRTVEILESQLYQMPPGAIGQLQEKLDATIASAHKLFTTLDQQVTQSSTLTRQTLQQIDDLVIQVNRLIQTLREQPSQLIFPSQKPDPFERK